MITPLSAKLNLTGGNPRVKIAARSPSLSCSGEADVRLRPSTVAFSDGAAAELTLPDGEALVLDVRAGVTPAEHVQRKLMSLLRG